MRSMADRNSSLESSGLSAEETCTSAVGAPAHSTPSSCETMLWEGWTSQGMSTADEASTTALHLPELATSSSSRLSFHHQSDLLSTMLSHFQPLTSQTDAEDHSPGSFFQEHADSDAAVSFGGMSANPSKNVYLSGIPCPLPSKRDESFSQYLYSKSGTLPQLQVWQPLPGPESPSSPLTLSHGPWPGATSSATIHLLQDAMVESSAHDAERSRKLDLFPFGDHQSQFHGDHGRILVPTAHNVHSDIHVHNNFGVQATPWTPLPETHSVVEPIRGTSTRSQQFMNFVRIAQEQRAVEHSDPDNSSHDRGYGGSKSGKHRQMQGGENSIEPAPKRPHLQAVNSYFTPRFAFIVHDGEVWPIAVQFENGLDA